MMQQAITLEVETICGLEEHQHGEDCFDQEGNLICPLPEHVHTAACYPVTEPEEEPEETPADPTEAPITAPDPESPTEETPAEETPSEETPAEETPSEETPSEETPSEETPSEETPSEETPTEETPTEETPTEETPAEETPTEETPSEETPSEEAPAPEMPTEEPSAETEPVVTEDPAPAEGEATPAEGAQGEEMTVTLPIGDNVARGDAHFDPSAVTPEVKGFFDDALTHWGFVSGDPATPDYAYLEYVGDQTTVTITHVDIDGITPLPYIPELASGENYKYDFKTKLTSTYITDYTLSWYKVDANTDQAKYFSIRYNDKPIETHFSNAATWNKLDSTTSIYVNVCRDAQKNYWVFMITEGGTFGTDATISGTAMGLNSQTAKNITKSCYFNPELGLYDYEINILIPHSINNFNQGYKLSDTANAPIIGDYKPFQVYDTDATAYVTNSSIKVKKIIGTDGEGNPITEEIPSVENWTGTVEDDSITWYMDSSGTMWFLNSNHNHNTDPSHYIDNLFLPVAYRDDWCACWHQMDDNALIVSYIDYTSKTAIDQNAAGTFHNTATIQGLGNDSTNLPAITDLSLLSKGYDPTTKVYTITIDASLFRNEYLGEITYFDIHDSMDIAFVKKGAGDAPELFEVYCDSVLLTKGDALDPQDYTVNPDPVYEADDFTVRIYNPKGKLYEIRYMIDLKDGHKPYLSQINNSASLESNKDSLIQRSTKEFFAGEFSWSDATSTQFSLQFLKRYEGTAPAVGAEFSVYRVTVTQEGGQNVYTLNSTPTCVSRVEDVGGQMKRVVYGGPTLSLKRYEDLYIPNDDVVFFNMTCGVLPGNYYAIVETQAPDGYLASDEVFYFFAQHPNGTIPAELDTNEVYLYRREDGNIENGNTWVGFMDLTSVIAVTDMFYNHLFYALPVTGGIGVMKVELLGVALLAAAGVGYVLLKKRKEKS